MFVFQSSPLFLSVSHCFRARCQPRPQRIFLEYVDGDTEYIYQVPITETDI